MNKKPTILPMLLRGALLLGAFLLPFTPIGTRALWPESKYARLWELTVAVCVIGAFIVTFRTRARRKRPLQAPGEDLDSSTPGRGS